MNMTNHTARATWRSERGQSLIETALTLPILLLIAVGIFEFGRAYQTWQVVTNAAREGARMAVLPDSNTGDVQARVKQYLKDGQLTKWSETNVSVTPTQMALAGGTTVSSSVIQVDYPFDFMVLNPVAKLVVKNSSLGSAFTMTARAQMRNESPD